MLTRPLGATDLQVSVLGFGGAPLGNLYSDGEKIWVHGANRLYVLGKSLEAGDEGSDDAE